MPSICKCCVSEREGKKVLVVLLGDSLPEIDTWTKQLAVWILHCSLASNQYKILKQCQEFQSKH